MHVFANIFCLVFSQLVSGPIPQFTAKKAAIEAKSESNTAAVPAQAKIATIQLSADFMRPRFAEMTAMANAIIQPIPDENAEKFSNMSPNATKRISQNIMTVMIAPISPVTVLFVSSVSIWLDP